MFGAAGCIGTAIGTLQTTPIFLNDTVAENALAVAVVLSLLIMIMIVIVIVIVMVVMVGCILSK